MKTVRMQKTELPGTTGTLARNLTKNWLMGLRESNPSILEMFADRDKKPYRDLLPWSGEFAGKYITGGYYIYRLTLDRGLYQQMQAFLAELVSLQAENGYLGCYSQDCQLTGAFSQNPDKVPGTWDAWAHYHTMLGLLLWYGETGNPDYLQAVERAAGLFLEKFYNPASGGKRLAEIGSCEMNLAPLHVFVLLYEQTGKRAYLDFAREIATDIAHPDAGNYLQHALNGLEYYLCPKPRWESLHVIMGMAELYRATGEEMYLQASLQIYRSIQKTDVHNTGAFSTNEQAVGNPFTSGKIETCCVIAYNALALDLFKLTGDPSILDFLELSHYNACMGFWSPSGRWSTYHTPMNGVKISNATDIVFQSRPGSPDLNCCSVNAARGIGMIGEWVLMDGDGVRYLNHYEPATYVTEDGSTLEVRGKYPMEGTVQITVRDYQGRFGLRIPAWSAKTTIICGGVAVEPEAGGFWVTDCQRELELTLQLDLSTRYLRGEVEFEGLYSAYRGPILFGTDVRLAGDHSVKALPAIRQADLEQAVSYDVGESIRIDLENGVTLADFYHLGQTGAEYVTWLPIEMEEKA